MSERSEERATSPSLRLVTPSSVLVPESLEPTRPELSVSFGGELRGVVQELSEWGMRLTLTSATAMAVAEVVEFELRDRSRAHLSGRARVVGLAEYELGHEALLWIVEGMERWRELARRFHELAHAPHHPLRPRRMRLPEDRIARRLSALTAERSRSATRAEGSR